MVQRETLKKILYISYDGLTDPLGQSQIIPYLQGLTKYGYRFTILSFEKKERYHKQKKMILEALEPYSIEWVPLSFTTNPPILSKAYDAFRMKRKVAHLHRKNSFWMTHCRSYIAADAGLLLKGKHVKFLFDMRGFWADEKRDGGAWNMNNPIFKNVYKYYKRKEAQYLQRSDHIISLTEAAKREMLTWVSYKDNVPITIIPCCADMNHFSLTESSQKMEGRRILGLPADCLVVSYLGSLGAWYMLDEMLELFSKIKNRYPSAIFLFITHSKPSLIIERLSHYHLTQQDVVITEATRQEVPVFTKASDINISFIKPVYSKISSSPTKLGEVLSMGIPVICNAGVGDVEKIVQDAEAGYVLKEFSDEAYEGAVNYIPQLLAKEPLKIRERIRPVYSLESGVALYREVYKNIESNQH